jgi:hypothetical protein
MTPDVPFESDTDETAAAGRSKEMDAAALQAAKEQKANKDFRVVPEDMQGGSSGNEPQGNR